MVVFVGSATAAPPAHFSFDGKWRLSEKKGSPRIRSPASATATATQRRCTLARKCARLVKEQRARFYIMRRCVTMLICWRDYADY